MASKTTYKTINQWKEKKEKAVKKCNWRQHSTRKLDRKRASQRERERDKGAALDSLSVQLEVLLLLLWYRVPLGRRLIRKQISDATGSTGDALMSWVGTKIERSSATRTHRDQEKRVQCER